MGQDRIGVDRIRTVNMDRRGEKNFFSLQEPVASYLLRQTVCISSHVEKRNASTHPLSIIDDPAHCTEATNQFRKKERHHVRKVASAPKYHSVA